jgi:hypothetical protein
MIKETDMNVSVIESRVLDGIATTTTDPFDYIYEAIYGVHGDEIREFVDDLYQSVSIDHRLHPDDDFEEIINRILDDLGA